MEIEKKFLIKKMPQQLESYEKKEIEQGYLCRRPTLRIRKSNKDYYFTFKSKVKSDITSAVVNEELELPLTEEAYLHLREKVDNNLIRKTRYIVPLCDGHIAELDVFYGALFGLCFVEVEFESEEAAESFNKPEWFGDEVSGNKHYSNGFLSTVESLDELGN